MKLLPLAVELALRLLAFGGASLLLLPGCGFGFFVGGTLDRSALTEAEQRNLSEARFAELPPKARSIDLLGFRRYRWLLAAAEPGLRSGMPTSRPSRVSVARTSTAAGSGAFGGLVTAKFSR